MKGAGRWIENRSGGQKRQRNLSRRFELEVHVDAVAFQDGVQGGLEERINGDAVANISLATSESWKDKATGEKREITEWHRVVFYRKLAEIVGQYLKKGSEIYVEGRIRTRKWQDKEGQDRYTTEIEANEMQMLGGRPAGSSAGDDASSGGGGGGNEGGTGERQRPGPAAKAPSFDDLDDDIPFTSRSIDADRMFQVRRLGPI